MLVTFTCKAYADITMFGDVAVSLLKMMGHSGDVPGALLPKDIPSALARLRSALATSEAEGAGDEEEGPRVSMSLRARPLIELLEAALREDTPVLWDK